MAANMLPGKGGEEKEFDAADRREAVDDRRDSAHPVHATIFQVRAVCPECKGHEIGTCFMVDQLQNNVQTGDFYYFVTAAHVIYCHKHRTYRSTQIVYEWSTGEQRPKRAFMPSVDCVEEYTERGWLTVPDAYKVQCQDENGTAYDRYPHDYGVVALRKQSIESFDPTLKKELDDYLQYNKAVKAQSKREDFVTRSFLCGFPGKVRRGISYVRGQMYWVPEKASKEGKESELTLDKRSADERGTVALYSMPQCHVSQEGDGDGSSDTKALIVKERLFRHYIDSSGGQSGSPVYKVVPNDDDDEKEYRVVGIHLGYWELSGGECNSCNVAMRISEVFKVMKEWTVTNHGKCDGKPVSKMPEGYEEEEEDETVHLMSTVSMSERRGRKRKTEESSGSEDLSGKRIKCDGNEIVSICREQSKQRKVFNPWTVNNTFNQSCYRQVRELEPSLLLPLAVDYYLLNLQTKTNIVAQLTPSDQMEKFLAHIRPSGLMGYLKLLRVLDDQETYQGNNDSLIANLLGILPTEIRSRVAYTID